LPVSWPSDLASTALADWPEVRALGGRAAPRDDLAIFILLEMWAAPVRDPEPGKAWR
jgi:hypothetical protein